MPVLGNSLRGPTIDPQRVTGERGDALAYTDDRYSFATSLRQGYSESADGGVALELAKVIFRFGKRYRTPTEFIDLRSLEVFDLSACNHALLLSCFLGLMIFFSSKIISC